MSNPFNALNKANLTNNNSMQNLRGLYQTLTSSRNPTQLFKQLAQRNPNLQPIVNMLDSGVNPQQIFNNLCQQQGINPQEFMHALTGK